MFQWRCMYVHLMCFVRDHTRAGVTNPLGVPHRSINSSITQRRERLRYHNNIHTHHWLPHSHSPLAYSSLPSHNHLNHHHQHHTTNTPTTSIIIILVVIVITCSTIHLLTPHTKHRADIIHSFQHKSSPSFNDHELSNAIPFTHSPPLFTRHTYRTSTTATSINNDVYSKDNRKTGQNYTDLVNIVNSVKKHLVYA